MEDIPFHYHKPFEEIVGILEGWEKKDGDLTLFLQIGHGKKLSLRYANDSISSKKKLDSFSGRNVAVLRLPDDITTKILIRLVREKRGDEGRDS